MVFYIQESLLGLKNGPLYNSAQSISGAMMREVAVAALYLFNKGV